MIAVKKKTFKERKATRKTRRPVAILRKLGHKVFKNKTRVIPRRQKHKGKIQ